MTEFKNQSAHNGTAGSRSGDNSRPAFCTHPVPQGRLLSVIVPVYNMASEDRLSWCMNSLLHQTLENYEIIAVDDCSTDGSLAILRELEEQNRDRLHVVASNRNRHH